jgi:hypothetical protein
MFTLQDIQPVYKHCFLMQLVLHVHQIETLHLCETLQQHHVKTGLPSALRRCVPASASSHLRAALSCNTTKRDTARLRHIVVPARSTPDRTPRGLGSFQLPSARGAASSVNKDACEAGVLPLVCALVSADAGPQVWGSDLH